MSDLLDPMEAVLLLLTLVVCAFAGFVWWMIRDDQKKGGLNALGLDEKTAAAPRADTPDAAFTKSSSRQSSTRR